MKFIFTFLLAISFVASPVLAKNLTLACKLFNSATMGGTYYEANVVGKNMLASFKVINVTGGLSSTLSSQKGPFLGSTNGLGNNSYWKNYVRYTNLTQTDCRYNQCLSLVIPADLTSIVGHKFGGYVTMKNSDLPGAHSITCEVY